MTNYQWQVGQDIRHINLERQASSTYVGKHAVLQLKVISVKNMKPAIAVYYNKHMGYVDSGQNNKHLFH
jgi:hypothetical protein